MTKKSLSNLPIHGSRQGDPGTRPKWVQPQGEDCKESGVQDWTKHSRWRGHRRDEVWLCLESLQYQDWKGPHWQDPGWDLWFVNYRLHRQRESKQQSHAPSFNCYSERGQFILPPHKVSPLRLLLCMCSLPHTPQTCQHVPILPHLQWGQYCSLCLQRSVASFSLLPPSCLLPYLFPIVSPSSSGPLCKSILIKLLPGFVTGGGSALSGHTFVSECSWGSSGQALRCDLYESTGAQIVALIIIGCVNLDKLFNLSFLT